MKINWFPGHMKKALDSIRKEIEKVDVIIYVLDSRAPYSCLNPQLNIISGSKPILFVFNKIDISDEEKINLILKNFKSDKSDYMKLNSTQSGADKQIVAKLKSLASFKIKKYKDKGINITIRALVIGVPNCGKSTLVNNLCKKAKAITGNKPGVTKGSQWFSLDKSIEICDTPGTLYPNLADQEIAKNLAFIGSIKDDIVDPVMLARELLEKIEKLYPGKIKERYKNAQTLEEIAKTRGYVLQRGEMDIERTALAVLNDFRSGKIGKINLEEV